MQSSYVHETIPKKAMKKTKYKMLYNNIKNENVDTPEQNKKLVNTPIDNTKPHIPTNGNNNQTKTNTTPNLDVS